MLLIGFDLCREWNYSITIIVHFKHELSSQNL